MTARPSESTPMGQMKNLLITIHNGGDEAVAAVQRMGDDWRAQLEQAAKEVEELRLTDAERALLVRLAAECDHPRAWTHRSLTADDRGTLRGLLDRTK